VWTSRPATWQGEADHHVVKPTVAASYRSWCASSSRRYADAMATETRADPVELTRLAGTVLTASTDLAEAWQNAKAPLAIPLAAFGNSNNATAVHETHQSAVDEADVTIGRQVAVLEGDADRLYRVAFAYEKADQDARAEVLRAAGAGAP
jgi:hypothetical protein